MSWLFLSILFSSILYVIFKLFERFQINNLQAIVANYAVAACTALVMSNNTVPLKTILQANWLPWALTLGVLFITVFQVVAITSQHHGLSVAAVASKMSMVIPITIGFMVYQEHATFFKILGICIALLAIYFTTKHYPEQPNKRFNFKSLLFPAALFVGSGVIDSMIKHLEMTFITPSIEGALTATIFSSAFLLGLLAMGYRYFKTKQPVQLKSLFAGIVLGIPNYFSIYFLIKALGYNAASSVVYPINHVGTIVLSTLFGILFFRERLQGLHWLGLFLAVTAIGLIAFAKA